MTVLVVGMVGALALAIFVGWVEGARRVPGARLLRGGRLLRFDDGAVVHFDEPITRAVAVRVARRHAAGLATVIYPRRPENNGPRAVSAAVKSAVWRRDGGRCTQCGSRVQLEFDHDIPFSKGGSGSANNIRLLCRSCNRRKSDRI